jgi:hypothetical protein
MVFTNYLICTYQLFNVVEELDFRHTVVFRSDLTTLFRLNTRIKKGSGHNLGSDNPILVCWLFLECDERLRGREILVSLSLPFSSTCCHSFKRTSQVGALTLDSGRFRQHTKTSANQAL